MSAPIGSSKWLEATFSAPPARDPRGRSRPTQRAITRAIELSAPPHVSEAGNTGTARSLLNIMQNLGVVKRFKLEPFKLTEAEHGVEAIPDVLFEHTDGRSFVVENKSAAYFTEEKKAKCKAVGGVLTSHGLTYLLWTDAWPLGRNTYRLMRSARRLGNSQIPADQAKLLRQVLEQKASTVAELRAVGLYRDTVLHEVWNGRACTNLFNELTDDSIVSLDAGTSGFDAVLVAPVESHGWWNRLARA